MPSEIVGYKPFAVQLPKWDMDVTIVRTNDGRTYFAVRHICEALGLARQPQLTALQSDERYADALQGFRIPTEGGMQDVVCLRRRECAWWLANINPKKCAATVRDRLEEFQADLMAEADRLAWGDLSSVLPALQIDQPIRGELTCNCPRCGAALCFTIAETGVHLRINT
jgi:hypothetical protein